MQLPQDWRRARATLAIAGLTLVAWLLVMATGLEQQAAVWGGFIPARVAGAELDYSFAPLWITPLTAALIHAGVAHLAFNLIILLFCGRAVEGLIGPAAFAGLYVTGAYVAIAVHYLALPYLALISAPLGDPVAPVVGASGAVSAVIGAYALLFGRNRVRSASDRTAQWLHVLWLAAAWIGLQVLTGITFETAGARLAIAAHIGGFVWGLLLARPLLFFRYRKA